MAGSTGVYRATLRTLVDGEEGNLALDSSGNLKTVSSGSGSSADQVQGNVAHDAVDSGNPVKTGGNASYTPPTAVAVGDRVNSWLGLNGQAATFLTDKNGNTFDAGVVNTDLTAATIILPVAAVIKPVTAGGLANARVVTGTTGVIKASAGHLFKITAYNVNAAARYMHLYNKATAPTLSTDTPVITIPLLGASVRDIDLGGSIGREFTTGIAWSYTTDDVAIPVTAGTSTELHFSAGYK